MTAPSTGQSRPGGRHSGLDPASRFGVATPGSQSPTSATNGRRRLAGEQEPEEPQPGRWQSLATWKKVVLFVGVVVLLIGGGFLAGWLTLGPTTQALRLTNGVHAGATLRAEDLKAVGLNKGVEGLVPAGKMGEVVGQTARTNLPEGTLLQQNQFVPHEVLPGQGQYLVPLALKPGQIPAGLAVGDLVGIVAPPPGNQQGGTFTPVVLATDVPVWSIREPAEGGSGVLRVTLRMGDAQKARDVAAFDDAGPVSLVRVGSEQQQQR